MTNQRLPLQQSSNQGSLTASNFGERLSESELATVKVAVGNRLKEGFDTDNYSEIGRKLNITAMNAKLYADGARFPSPEILLQFRRVTGISTDWLLTGEGQKYVKIGNVFTEAEEEEIRLLARENGRSFLEQTAKLATAGLRFLEKLNSWKKE
jgi:transcriptional regulator with XRE-family HTH domain